MITAATIAERPAPRSFRAGSHPLDGKIDVMDTLTSNIVKTIPIEFAAALAFNSIGTQVFIVEQIQGVVPVMDAMTYAPLAKIEVGASPDEIGIGPNDAFAVVTNYDGQSVTLINLTGCSTTTVAVPGRPMGLSLRY